MSSRTSPTTPSRTFCPRRASIGLYLTLANQNLSQLKANPGRQNILDAVLGNVGNLIAFRIGPSDAEKLWPYTEPEFGSLDLQGLPNYHAVGRLLTAQGPTRPFVFRTLPPTKPRGYKRTGAEAWAIKEKSFTQQDSGGSRNPNHSEAESHHEQFKCKTMSRRIFHPLVLPMHLEAPPAVYAYPINPLPHGAPFSPIHLMRLLAAFAPARTRGLGGTQQSTRSSLP